jgi:hypothetical protein
MFSPAEGHFRACAAKLRNVGAQVLIGLCGGRTLYDQKNRAFEMVEEQLVNYEPCGSLASP